LNGKRRCIGSRQYKNFLGGKVADGKGNNWLELFRDWILMANQAKNIAVGENLEEK